MNNEFSSQPDLQFDSVARTHLSESARWGHFLSIVAFVMIGLMVLGALAIMAMGSSIYNSFPGGLGAFAGVGIGLLYLIIAAIYLYPTLKLYNFSKNAKLALSANDSHLLSESMRHLSGIFKFFGIITAIVLGIYALIFVFVLLAGVMGR